MKSGKYALQCTSKAYSLSAASETRIVAAVAHGTHHSTRCSTEWLSVATVRR